MVNNNNEIDLIELFSNILKKIKRNLFLFISIITVFVILGIVRYSIQNEMFIYKSVATSSMKKEILSKFINDINSKNNKSIKIIPKLENIEISYNDELIEQDVFKVELMFNDTVGFKETINLLVSELENINYIKQCLESKKQFIQNQINNYTNEINKINKIQDLIFKKENSNTTIISTNGLSKEKIEFQKLKMELEKEYNNIASIKIIINDFNQFETTKNLIVNILLFFILGFVISTVIILFKK